MKEVIIEAKLVQVLPQKNTLKDILANDDTDWKEFLATAEESKFSDEDIDTALNQFDEWEMMLCGLKQKISELSNRQSRIKDRTASLKNFIIHMMEERGHNTLKKPSYTVSLKRLKHSVVIEDESEIPSKYFKVSEPTLDKKLINEDIKAGEDIPGTSVPTGKKLSLSIRKN